MSSSYRLKRRKEDGVWDFGPFWSHYVKPFNECYPGDLAIPIGNENGVKVCIRKEYLEQNKPKKDSLLEKSRKGEKVNGLYKSYNLYHPSAEFQNRPFNPWPEGGMDRQTLIANDYVKVPIRYNTTGFDNMRQISGEEFAYGWEVVDYPQPVNFEVTRLHSSREKGDLRGETWYTTKHPGKKDFYHTKEVLSQYPNNYNYQWRKPNTGPDNIYLFN
jgi:hypothetical protein